MKLRKIILPQSVVIRPNKLWWPLLWHDLIMSLLIEAIPCWRRSRPAWSSVKWDLRKDIYSAIVDMSLTNRGMNSTVVMGWYGIKHLQIDLCSCRTYSLLVALTKWHEAKYVSSSVNCLPSQIAIHNYRSPTAPQWSYDSDDWRCGLSVLGTKEVLWSGSIEFHSTDSVIKQSNLSRGAARKTSTQQGVVMIVWRR